MFKIWYAVENAWGVDTDELDGVQYATLEEAVKVAKESFEPYEEWWIEDEDNNVIDGNY